MHVVFGWKLPHDLTDGAGNKINVYEDEFLRYVEGWKGEKFTIINDHMMGEYIVFGLNIVDLNSSDENDFREIDVSSLNAAECIDKFRAVFGGDPGSEPKVLAFIHCS